MSTISGGLGLRRARRARAVPRPARAPRRTAAAHSGSTEFIAVGSSVLTMVALVSLWFVVQVLVLSSVSADRAQQVTYDAFRTQLAEATAPTGPIVAVGKPVALLSVPNLDLEQVITEGTASGDLLGGPGHRRDTVLPGQRGVSVVYGRAATYGAPFKRLAALAPRDQIIVIGAQGRTVFTVDSVRRAGDPLPPPPTAKQARLTLVSAESQGRLASLRGADAIFVDATAQTGFDFPAGRPTAVPSPEKAMASDLGALPKLALCLALLLALTYAVIRARQRLSASLVWVMAAPIALALAWATTDEVMRLLPNLL